MYTKELRLPDGPHEQTIVAADSSKHTAGFTTQLQGCDVPAQLLYK